MTGGTALTISQFGVTRNGCAIAWPASTYGKMLWCPPVVSERKEWKFFGVLPKADPGLAAGWWAALLLRGILPAVFAIAMGVLVGAVQARATPGRSARAGRRHLRAAAGAGPDSSGRQRESRRPHRGVAL